MPLHTKSRKNTKFCWEFDFTFHKLSCSVSANVEMAFLLFPLILIELFVSFPLIRGMSFDFTIKYPQHITHNSKTEYLVTCDSVCVTIISCLEGVKIRTPLAAAVVLVVSLV